MNSGPFFATSVHSSNRWPKVVTFVIIKYQQNTLLKFITDETINYVPSSLVQNKKNSENTPHMKGEKN